VFLVAELTPLPALEFSSQQYHLEYLSLFLKLQSHISKEYFMVKRTQHGDPSMLPDRKLLALADVSDKWFSPYHPFPKLRSPYTVDDCCPVGQLI
jgi:hypothetical protein